MLPKTISRDEHASFVEQLRVLSKCTIEAERISLSFFILNYSKFVVGHSFNQCRGARGKDCTVIARVRCISFRQRFGRPWVETIRFLRVTIPSGVHAPNRGRARILCRSFPDQPTCFGSRSVCAPPKAQSFRKRCSPRVYRRCYARKRKKKKSYFRKTLARVRGERVSNEKNRALFMDRLNCRQVPAVCRTCIG